VTAFVLDASVALSWVFEDEYSPFAARLLDSAEANLILVPSIWSLEVANGLLSAVRRARMPAADAPYLLGTFDRLQVEFDRGPEPQALARLALALGLAHRLSAYDACYLELALRRGLPLATQDHRLARAAATAGVSVFRP
jgi:predicted nucleic acid-binding protein